MQTYWSLPHSSDRPQEICLGSPDRFLPRDTQGLYMRSTRPFQYSCLRKLEAINFAPPGNRSRFLDATEEQEIISKILLRSFPEKASACRRWKVSPWVLQTRQSWAGNVNKWLVRVKRSHCPKTFSTNDVPSCRGQSVSFQLLQLSVEVGSQLFSNRNTLIGSPLH